MHNQSTEGIGESLMHRGLTLMRQCPLCQHPYEVDTLSILEKREGTNLVHITCPACAHALLAIVTVSPLGMSSIGMLTDLTKEDTGFLKHRTPVSEETLLTFHTYIQSRFVLERHLIAAHTQRINA